MDERDEEVKLTGLAYGGDAIGRLADGRAVFVPYGLPGERVRLRIIEERRGHARARLLEVLEPSPERIIPRCPHFGVCGGCHYQHMTYDGQLTVKRRILADQLERIGGLAGVNVAPAVPSPREWNYRNHLQFHLAADGRLGFQMLDSHTVIPIQVCFLPEAAIDQAWPGLDFEQLPGQLPEIERVSLRQNAADDLLLVLEGSDPQPPEFTVDFDLSAVYQGAGESYLMAGDNHLLMTMLDREFRVTAGSFFQINSGLAERMVEHVLALLPGGVGQSLLDLYCGVGLFSAFLAPRFASVTGIELSESACDDFAFNLDEFEHVALYQGLAEEVLPALGADSAQPLHFNAAVVDPPRAGIERRALDALIAAAPETLVYVSCDPATLARDAKRLVTAGYRLEQVAPFDMFPQTFHVESVSLFRKP